MIWIFAVAMTVAEPPAALLRTGIFHRDEITAKHDSAWMALVKDQSSSTFTWRKVRIDVKTVFDEVTGEMNAKQVSIAGDLQPVLLLHRTYLWMSRPAKAVINQKTAADDLRLGDAARLRMNPDNALTFEDRGIKQVLYSWPSQPVNDEHRSLIWAGDLDGDGRLDLVVDVSEHANVSRIRLYLSSKRATGQLVGLAAELVQRGC